ncbi:MAG: winged helix-turn-helix transcriptional regulator [Sandaracinaceae bacterium]|nr:winged helix-turn-helix transcriptional regulator [Sandaracinaceae bacterium]
MAAAEKRRELAMDALGNPMRRRIVKLLRAGPLPVGSIAAELPVSRPAVSKHLRLLERAELVTFDKHGNRNLFRLNPSGFDAARGWLEEFWDEALARFARAVEDELEGKR